MLQRTPTVRYRHDPQKSRAAQRLNGSHVHLVYIGPRHPNFRPMLSVKDAGRIHFAESQPETQAAAYLQHCDAPSCPPRRSGQSGDPGSAAERPSGRRKRGLRDPRNHPHDWSGLTANLARLREAPTPRRQRTGKPHPDRHTAERHRDRFLAVLERVARTAKQSIIA
ncbi:hypothetical protein [Azospirillum cavernae]|uniref:hypothetical protein n=1 Tax=Azospirillum cavernae TaxID=2320860 RepID=UPI0011C41B6F|nr:hypothetical protein [Azospirillum cavernae]